MGRSEATVRRMVRAGKLAAHIEKRDGWGPTWIINETDIQRMLTPEQPEIEILAPEYEAPTQVLRDVREGLAALHKESRSALLAVKEELQAQQAEIAGLRNEIAALRADRARERKRWPLWPFK